MGCASARDQVYVSKNQQISIPDIKDSVCDLDSAPNHLPNIACGYQFDINLQNSGHQSPFQRQKQLQNAERAKGSQFIDNFEEMKSHFLKGRIDQAYHFQQILSTQYREIDFNRFPELQTDKRQQMIALAQRVERSYQQLKEFQKQLLTDQWQETKQEQELKIKYKRAKDYCYVFVETEAEVCLELMVATMGSLGKYHQFMKFAHSSKEIKRFSIFQRLGEVVYDIPFYQKTPKSLEEIVIDRLSHNNSVIISYSSLTSNSQLSQKWQHHPNVDNESIIDFPVIIGKIEPMETDKTRIGIMFKIKNQSKVIADWIMDKLYKNIAIGSIKKLVQKARAFGEETDTDVFEADDELYHHFNHLMKAKDKKIMD